MADSQFPQYTTTFIGRNSEAQAIAELLRDPTKRLVSMIGPSGAGKTRLSLQVVELVREAFPDGCLWVALAPVTDPTLVLPTIAKSLDIRELSDVPLRDTLSSALAKKQLLLVLDNVEQVQAAAPELAELIEHTASLTLLVTSQTPLELELETRFEVAPLAIPAPQAFAQPRDLLTYPAVALFVERIKAVQPSFELDIYNAASVVEICNRVLGLPLAIELVAAHSHQLTPDNLLLLLRNYLPMRKKTEQQLTREELIKPVLNWCYRVLIPDQQRVLIRCGIFSGGWDQAAAERICNLPGNRMDIQAALEYLASRHLLLTERLADGSLRYHMIDAIHDYAFSQLKSRRRYDEVAQLHGHWFAELASLTDSARSTLLDKLSREHHNLREALTYFIQQRNAPMAVQIAGDLGVYWYMRGHWSEGFRLLKEVEVLTPDAPVLAQAKAYNWIAAVSTLRGATMEAKAYFLKALGLYEQAGNAKGVMKIHNNLGIIERDLGNYEVASNHMEVALDMVKDDDPYLATAIANNLGLAYRSTGNTHKALELFLQYLPISKQDDDEYNYALTLLNLGAAHNDLAQYPQAEPYLEAALKLYRTMDIKHYVADTLCVLAHTHLKIGHQIKDAQLLMAESIKLRSELQDFRGLVISFELMIDFALYVHQPEAAARFLGAAQAIRERMNYRTLYNWPVLIQQVKAHLAPHVMTEQQQVGAEQSDQQRIEDMLMVLHAFDQIAS